MSSWSFHLFAAVLTTTQQLVAAAADPCDVSMTDATLHTAPVVVDGCPTPFDDEQALLDASTRCAARTSSGGSVCHSMRRGWWAAARALTPLVDDRGRTSVRQHAEGLRAGAASVNLEVLRGGSSKASGLSGEGLNVVTPACQWAQNSTVAAVAVRFSPKRYTRAHPPPHPRRSPQTLTLALTLTLSALALTLSPQLEAQPSHTLSPHTLSPHTLSPAMVPSASPTSTTPTCILTKRT